MSMSRGASMDAISLDDWELLPDHRSSFLMDAAECSNGSHGVDGGKDQLLLGAELVVIDMDHFGPTSSHPPPPCDYCILHEEAKKPLLLLPSEDACGGDPIADNKDIDVVADELEREEELVSEVTEILVYEAEEQEEIIESVQEADQDDDDDVLVEAAVPDGVSQCAREEEEEEGVSKTGFGVGSLRVNGVGALCSFGVAAATFLIFLLGGGGKQQQQQHKRQGHKIQLQQMYAGDERILQVVQQASRLNQTLSSVMGGASSARASISFGGYYQGF